MNTTATGFIFHKDKFTSQEYIALSWFAYYCRAHKSEQLPHVVVTTARNFCQNVLNIPYEYICEVEQNNNCNGLQNMNRLESIETWDY